MFSRYVKIPFTIVDELSKLINMLLEVETKLEDLSFTSKELRDIVREYRRIVTRMSDIVMNLKLVSLEPVFKQLMVAGYRIAEELGKKVLIHVEGGNIRVDRKLAETLPDILIHLVRNAIDHGIEPPSERLSKGKTEYGNITIGARQEGNYVVLYVLDDGKGIDIEKVKKKAVEKGLIKLEDVNKLAWKDIVDILTTPGFSTRDEVTKYSGRGVGLDVVRRFAESLGGFIDIWSEKNKGTKVSIYVPYRVIALRLLALKIGNICIAIPLQYVLRITHLNSEIVKHNNVLFENRWCRLMYLDSENYRYRYVVYVEAQSSEPIAIPASDVEGQYTLAVTPIPRLSRAPRFISGIAVKGEDICFVLDVNSFYR